MRRILFSLIILSPLLYPKKVLACEICGCGVSSPNPYLFPHLSKNYVGLAYYHYRYQVAHGGDHTETYRRLVLTGQFRISDPLLVTAIFPYEIQDHKSLRSESTQQGGPGDASVLLSFRTWEKTAKTSKQTLTLGVGIKLSTGRHKAMANEQEQRFQLGTGSMDYLVNAGFRYAIGKWMAAVTTDYKYNTSNSDSYRLGDVWNNTVSAIYRHERENLSLLPYLSLSREQFMRDAEHHLLRNNTGGDAWLAMGGVDVNTQRVTVGVNYSIPIIQQMGILDIRPRFAGRISFIF